MLQNLSPDLSKSANVPTIESIVEYHLEEKPILPAFSSSFTTVKPQTARKLINLGVKLKGFFPHQLKFSPYSKQTMFNRHLAVNLQN